MAKPELRTAPLTTSEYAEWNRMVQASPSGSIYARPEYLDALCVAAGGRFRILGVRQGDQLLGGVALYERDSSFGTFVSPRLLLYYNGPVLAPHDTKYPSEQTARLLKVLGSLEAELRKGGYGSIVLKPRALGDVRPFLARGWSGTQGYTYVVSISDLGALRARVEQNLRRLIERCGRADMNVTADDDFESFYRLHAATMDRVAFEVYLPERAFRGFHDTLARQRLAQLYHARLPSGQVVASQLVLLGHPVTHTVTAGADTAHLKSGVTAFLRWKAFEQLNAVGHVANDLTDATLNAVTHFKSQLGGALEGWIELRSPESGRYKWGQRGIAVARGLRGAAASLARRALRRSAPVDA